MITTRFKTRPVVLQKTVGEDWSFAQLKRVETLWGPHGYHRYPAKFIPQLVRRIINLYSCQGSLVADPFLGSATTGIEALRSGRRFWGGDINPVALLISKAKCAPIHPALLQSSWERLELKVSNLKRIGRRTLTALERSRVFEINIYRASPEERFEYWFPSEHAKSLNNIFELINQLTESEVKTFFRCGFSNILRGSSIWLSGSTKPQKDLSKYLADPVESFLRQARDMIRRNGLFWNDLTTSKINPENIAADCHIGLYDARNLPLKSGEVDLLVTSPPYATCYQYLDIHQLTQLWFDRYNLLPKVNVHHGCIGDLHLSEKNGQSKEVSTGSLKADRALRKLEQVREEKNKLSVSGEIRALRNYFQDMKSVMNEFSRVVAHGKYLVLIVGDSRKRGVKIPTSAALCEMAMGCGFDLEDRIVRKIPVRVLVSTRDKTTGRFSSTEQSNSEVYPEEEILVFRRLAR